MDWHVGDIIDSYEMIDESGQYFIAWEPFTISGIVEHVDHVCTSLDETPYILVLPSLFDHDSLEGCCMKAEVSIGALPDENRFSEADKEASTTVQKRIEELAAERTLIRDAALKEKAYALADEYEESYKETLEEKLALRESLQNDPDASEEDIEENESYIAYLESSLEELDEQRGEIENITPTRWIVLTEYGSPSFVQLLAGSDNLSKLRMSFALMFMIISVLVIYASVSKMVDEQRTLIGTTKALGFHKREILKKYMIYGVSGTLIGSVIGMAAARFVLAGIALSGYGNYISVDITQPHFSAGISVIVLVICVLLSAAAVWSACNRLVRTPAVALMQPPAPKAKKAAAGNKKHILSLYYRLMLRNVRSDWKRVIVTVVSVAGCCSLLVNGFTLKSGVTRCVDNQYKKIMDYDWEIDCWDFAIPEIKEILEENGAEGVPVFKTTLLTYLDDTGIANLVCGDLSEISKLYHLYDWKTGEAITAANDGILIQQRLAEIYGLEVGSEIR